MKWFLFFLGLGLQSCRTGVPVKIEVEVGAGIDAGTVGGASSTGGAPATGGMLTTGGSPSTGGSAATLDDCQRADVTLNALKCPEAKTPKGTPFADACRRAAATKQDWHPECIAKVTSCAAVKAAYRGCK